jgi:O-antigen/teichoic acid export membrane protein
MHRLRSWITRQLRSDLGRSATWMLHGQGLQLAAQFAYFVIVAHRLGPTGFGTFVACTALVLTVSPFSSWGSGNVMVKYVSLKREALPQYFGNAIVVTITGGLLLMALLLLIRPFVLPAAVPAVLLISVAIADLICAQLTSICSLAFLAYGQARNSANTLALASLTRVIAAGILAITVRSPLYWGYLYCAAAAISATAGVLSVSQRCARPRFSPELIVPSVREGFHFATSESARSVYDNIDKTMLARLSTLDATAIYAVAYRFIDAAMLPVRALAAATYPEFFRHGQHGVTSSYRFAQRILKRSVLYGAGATICLFALAGVVPLVLGGPYAESSLALRWLCLLPTIKSVHSFLTDTLTGANYQWQRSSTQIGVALFNVLINLWLIRAFSWRGAAWSSLATDSLLLVSLYALIRWHLHREGSRVGRGVLAASSAGGS